VSIGYVAQVLQFPFFISPSTDIDAVGVALLPSDQQPRLFHLDGVHKPRPAVDIGCFLRLSMVRGFGRNGYGAGSSTEADRRPPREFRGSSIDRHYGHQAGARGPAFARPGGNDQVLIENDRVWIMLADPQGVRDREVLLGHLLPELPHLLA
jgi:hypothetical protein